jgi:glycosyltransferase involved in cell wall biosynthesis
MKPLVSILIPAYNAEKWLAETLRSALAQTWDNKEIIVVDDGSKDGTLALARTFESDIVRVYTKENQGAAATRNKAFSFSKGEYIQWLDADDLIGPDKIRLQIEALGNRMDSRMLLSGEWASFMYRPARARFTPSGLWCDLSKSEWLIQKMSQNVYMQTATWLVSRELTEAAGPWDTRLLGDDDGEYFCRVLMASNGVRFVPGSKVYYRQAASGSLSHIGVSEKKQDAQWLSMKMHIGYLRSLDDSEQARATCVKYLQNWMIFFYKQRPDLFESAGQMAKELGGSLELPHFSRKYAWIQLLFGWRTTRKIQLKLQLFRWNVLAFFDRTLWRLERTIQPFDLSS